MFKFLFHFVFFKEDFNFSSIIISYCRLHPVMFVISTGQVTGSKLMVGLSAF